MADESLLTQMPLSEQMLPWVLCKTRRRLKEQAHNMSRLAQAQHAMAGRASKHSLLEDDSTPLLPCLCDGY